MERKSSIGVFVLGAALIVGIASDLLLKGTSWGVNVLPWTVLTLFTIHLTIKNRDPRGIRRHRYLAGTALVFAALFAWRDSTVLKSLDATALFSLLVLLGARAHMDWSPWQPFSEYLARAGGVLAASARGPSAAIREDIRWEEISSDQSISLLKAVGRGLAISLPILAAFGALFSLADARFERLVSSLADIDGSSAAAHAAVILGAAWLAAGFLRLTSQQASSPISLKPYPLALGVVEIGILLALVDLLFAAFVVLQLPYLFGGAAHITGSIGVTYAQYARRGFFELACVAALVLPLLLHAHAMLRTAGRGGENSYRLLAGIMVGLVFIIMASATQRMQLYQDQFGLTELRFYTTAFIGWLALVFTWFIPTVLAGLRNSFTFGALAAGLCLVVVLHVVNPDALIFEVNAARAAEGKAFDVAYNSSLSADAFPAAVRNRRSRAAACLPAFAARKAHWKRDWRGWNWSRKTASDLLDSLTSPTAEQQAFPPRQSAPKAPAAVPVVSLPLTPEDRKTFKVIPLEDKSQVNEIVEPQTGRPAPAANTGM